MSKKQRKHQKQSQADPILIDQDENFYFIAGYTSGGGPYGITWEEERKLEEKDKADIGINDLPFK